jgi:hypothetical protein
LGSSNKGGASVTRWTLETAAVEPKRGPKLVAGLVLVVVAVVVPVLVIRILALASSGIIACAALIARRASRPVASLVATRRGLYREDATRATVICEWSAPFGVSWLVGKDALLAFTTAKEVRCVRVRLTGASADLIREIKRRAAPMTDATFEVMDEAASLDPTDALALVEHCDGRAPRCEGRLLASGLRGERVTLDGTNLVVNEKAFDLASPIEWRSSMFHEAGGASAMLFSALSVRQKGAEVVFVSPAQGELRPPFDGPPARESRVAIDALLLSPIRKAVTRAPRIKRSAPSAPRGPREQTA